MKSIFNSKISAEDEWSPLKAVIVGRATGSCFPSEPLHMIEATMPHQYHHAFRPGNPFPVEITENADTELEKLVSILQTEGIQVYRPAEVNWGEVQGYTGAMPRDGLITVGNRIIEACFAWESRRREISLGYSALLDILEQDPSVRVIRAPEPPFPDTLYNDVKENGGMVHSWAINNSRPAFDAADFMRFGRILIGQLSHVTNMLGVEYLRSNIPAEYVVELLETNDPNAMHIDATILPLRKGLLIYNPKRVTEKALRKHTVLKDWDLRPIPFEPVTPADTPLFMTSSWLMMNILSIDGKKVLVEENDKRFAEWLRTLGMEPIFCPFRHVWSLGGSFHCSTVDLVRER